MTLQEYLDEWQLYGKSPNTAGKTPKTHSGLQEDAGIYFKSLNPEQLILLGSHVKAAPQSFAVIHVLQSIAKSLTELHEPFLSLAYDVAAHDIGLFHLLIERLGYEVVRDHIIQGFQIETTWRRENYCSAALMIAGLLDDRQPERRDPKLIHALWLMMDQATEQKIIWSIACNMPSVEESDPNLVAICERIEERCVWLIRCIISAKLGRKGHFLERARHLLHETERLVVCRSVQTRMIAYDSQGFGLVGMYGYHNDLALLRITLEEAYVLFREIQKSTLLIEILRRIEQREMNNTRYGVSLHNTSPRFE